MNKAPQHITLITGTYAFIGSLVSLVGWMTDTPRLTDWWATGIVIKGNTALAILVTAISLFALVYSSNTSRYISRCFSLFVLLLGGLTLFQHIADINLGIDTLLFNEAPGAAATVAPGRMGPPAAISFVALGIGIYLRTLSEARHPITIGLSILVIGIGTLSMVGYLYGAEAMYTIPRLTGIAVQTATMLFALGIGLIATCAHREPMKTLSEDSNVGLIARRMLLVAFVVPVVLGWLRIQGFRAGFYDNVFGTALRSIVEIAVLVCMLWWSVQAIRIREIKQLRAEAEQHSSERRLIETLESMPDGFFTINEIGQFNYVNAAAAQIFGCSQSELIGAIWWQKFPAIRETALYTELQRAAKERISIEVEAPDFVANGQRHFCYRIHPDNKGGLSVYLQDVTERKIAQDALYEADRHKDEFIAVLAHELRNPLAPILNSAAILKTSFHSAQIVQSSARIIERQTQHMSRLLEDLLDISRISRNRLKISKQTVDIRQIIESAIETSLPVIQKANHELVVNLPAETIFVEADAVRLSQVFSNLLNNATQFTPSGGVIKVSAEYDNEHITVHIIDNGIGIENTSLTKIFSMFTQITPSSGVKSGLGIGLAFASNIIELHGGKIQASSAGLNKGSTFSVRLSRALPSESAPAAETSTPIELKKRRLLIVDDLKDSADSLAILLKQLGHDVAVAYGGHAAIITAESFRPDMIFLDIGMPGIDGIEVCQQIRQESWGKHMSIVALTGWGQAEDINRTREAGFNAHLVKPINPNHLINLLSDFSSNSN